MNSFYYLGRSVALLSSGFDHANTMLRPFALRHNFTSEDYQSFWDGYFAN